MKWLRSVFLAFSLALCGLALAQDNTKPSDDQAKQSQNTQNQNVSGTVSQDGRTFTNDKDNKSYTVTNPDALKGHEGDHVMLVVRVDPDTNAIYVSQVELPSQ
jgi:hypothetical protein